MSPLNNPTVPKAPRWITTESGQYAWAINEEWRRQATHALSVSERRHLLAQAERIRAEYDQLAAV